MSAAGFGTRTLDLEHLTRQTFGDRSLERELLGLFLQQCVRLVPIIGGEGERVERADAAHALRGAALAIGANRIASLTETLEGALDGDFPDESIGRLVLKLKGAVKEAEQAVALRWRQAA